MAIYTEMAPPLNLDKEYTGKISIEKNLMDGIKENWGNLLYPNAEISSPSVEYPKREPPEEEKRILILPDRLTTPQYGSTELNQNLRKMAEIAPGIEKIWEMTKDIPSLTRILLEEREKNE